MHERARVVASVLGLFLYATAQTAAAQLTGYELALSGPTTMFAGEHLRVAGTAFEVQGLSTLRSLPQAVLEAELVRYGDDRRRQVVTRGTFVADRDGHVVVDLAVPATTLPGSVELQIAIGRRGDAAPRRLEFPFHVASPYRFDLITDRVRYEPGETIHAFSLLRRQLSGVPVADARVHIEVRGPDGTVVAANDAGTRASGATFLDVALGAEARDGTYTVTVSHEGPGGVVNASRSVQVGQRTVERMLLDATVAEAVVAPGGAITGRANVRTASGAPIAGASVVVSIRGARTDLTTDAEGQVEFRLDAPAYLAGDIEHTAIEVRAEHPAYGMRRESVPIVLARSPYAIEIVEHGAALVPEVATRIYVRVVDPLGRPAPEGLEIEVAGTSVQGGRQTARVDRDGFAEIPMLVRVGAAGPLREEGLCTGSTGIRFDVTLNGERRMTAPGCAVVATAAMVSVRANSVVIAPGETIEVEVGRRPAVASAAVIVDLLHERRIVGSVFVPAGASTARLPLPAELAGWLELRARPLGRHEAVTPIDRVGSVSYGVGSSDAIFVRPSDAFGMTLDGGTEVYPVRGRASVRITTSSAPSHAFVTMVARDLAQHGGEVDFVLPWLVRFFEAAATSPVETGHERFVRAALASVLSADSDSVGVAPIVEHPWDEEPAREGPGPDTTRGELRDPIRLRDALLRSRAGELMVMIENFVGGQIGSDDDGPRITLRGGGFPPDLVARLIERGDVSSETFETLGGRVMTLAMLEGVDPAFRFENVAARLSRARLAKLMMALLSFTNPDDPEAARAIEGVPPSRWLSRLVELGMVEPNDLLDPWGRAFVFRPASGGTPRVVLSDRAPTYELVSPGPDGRPGTGDDVRDPFRRVLPEGTPYSVASGEDELMRSIASIAPAESTLQSMLRAYDTMSLAALDEQRATSVTATSSEEYDAPASEAAMDEMLGDLGTMGYGSGGGTGSGYGRGSGSLSGRAAAAPMVRPAGAASMDDRDGESRQAQASGSSLERVGEMIRERFPATLFFLGERPLASRDERVEIPLADALTTYRVEAIAWTTSGWVTTARTEIRVDQQATIDAAVPEFATVGDALRVPVRIENRGTTPLSVKVGIEAVGLAIDGGEVRTVVVPARGVAEETYPLRVTGLGEGRLVVRLVRADDDAALDAVQRPIRAYADARLVREKRRFFVEGSTSLAIDVPADASERGPAELRIATGFEFFGALDDQAGSDRLDRAWARAIARLEVSSADRELAVGAVYGLVDDSRIPPPIRPYVQLIWQDPTRLARALALAWNAPGFDRDLARSALEILGRYLPETNDRGESYEGQYYTDASILFALTPIATASGEHAEELLALVGRFRALVENAAARTSEMPGVAVLEAAALANTRGGARDARADEILRRLERIVVRSGDGTFLEGVDVGQPHAREVPTALLALAFLGQGDRAKAFEALRGLAGRPERTLVPAARLFAAAAAGRLLGETSDPRVVVRFDGTVVPLSADGAVRIASIPGVGRPGVHRLAIELPEGGAAFVDLDVRYGRPWEGAEARRLPVSVRVDGPVGARDTRAGLYVELRNQGARVLRDPVVEIDLPSGGELDEPARRALAAMTRTAPTIEARTLRLALRPLSPGARIRLPLGLRWTVGGTIRGLGVTVFDEAPTVGDTIARAVLASHAVELADRGAEPEAATPETEEPPPPPPPPPPIPLLRTLAPTDEVSR